MITINARNFDGSLRKSWTAEVVQTSDSLVIVKGIFETEVKHPHLGVIRRGTISYEFFWPDRWYNVFRFHKPDETFRNYYCNISMPPRMTETSVDYVDLDIDIIVGPSGVLTVLDEDEFRENAERFRYSDDIRVRTGEAIAELTAMIKGREFPFEAHGIPAT